MADVADEDGFFGFGRGGSTAQRSATTMVGLSNNEEEAVVVQEAWYGYFLCLLIRLLKWLAGSDVSGGGGQENGNAREHGK